MKSEGGPRPMTHCTICAHPRQRRERFPFERIYWMILIPLARLPLPTRRRRQQWPPSSQSSPTCSSSSSQKRRPPSSLISNLPPTRPRYFDCKGLPLLQTQIFRSLLWQMRTRAPIHPTFPSSLPTCPSRPTPSGLSVLPPLHPPAQRNVEIETHVPVLESHADEGAARSSSGGIGGFDAQHKVAGRVCYGFDYFCVVGQGVGTEGEEFA